MRNLARISLLLVIVLVVVSAYLRLHESGIGCPDWPACYGMIGQNPDQQGANMAESAYQRIVAESDAPLAWAAPLHRLVASLLGLAVLGLAGLAIRAKKHRLVCIVLLGLTVFLAVIGIRSGSLHSPAIVMGNLVGGFTMLGLLGWLVFRLGLGSARYTQTHIKHLRPWVLLALVMLCLQIILGGFTSANFAGTSCQTLPDCQGTYLPDATLYTAFKLTGSREVNESGMAVGGLERIAIHKAHRVGAILAFAAILAAGIAGIMGTGPSRNVAFLLLLLLVAEFTIGIASVMSGLPIALAVAHNWLAGLLLLVLLKMLALSHERWAPD